MVLRIIFILRTLSLLGILVNTEGEMYLVVAIFLYENICPFSFTFHALTYFLRINVLFTHYFLCINVTVKVKKKREYSVFTHRVSWGGSRKLTTFTTELFLKIVNGLRRSLKKWQSFWIHFKFSLPFSTSYVSHIICFYFERIFTCKPDRYLWVLYRGVFWIYWRKKFKDVSKYNCL